MLWILANQTKISSWGAIFRFALLIARRLVSNYPKAPNLLSVKRKPIRKTEVIFTLSGKKKKKKVKNPEEEKKETKRVVHHPYKDVER